MNKDNAKNLKDLNSIILSKTDNKVLKGLSVNGKIKSKVENGYLVDLDGREAFLPESTKLVLNEGESYDFWIDNVSNKSNEVTLSYHKILIEKDLEKQRQEIL